MEKLRLEKLDLNKFEDARGCLTVLEIQNHVDWDVKRLYWVTDVEGMRGSHAVKGEKKFYICMQGTMKAKFHDGKEWQEFELEGPIQAILMEGLYFREFYDFSEGSVLLAASNLPYSKEDYIMDFNEFLKIANQE